LKNHKSWQAHSRTRVLHSTPKFNFARNYDVRNCKYGPTLLIKYDLYDGKKNFRITKVLKNMSYIRRKVCRGTCHIRECLAKKRRQGAVKSCQPIRFVIKSVPTDLPQLYLEYLQVVCSCPCPYEVSVSLPRTLRRLFVLITWLPRFLVISPYYFVTQDNGTLHRQYFFRFGEF